MKRMILIPFLLCGMIALGQDDYVTHDGKTVQGMVKNNREWTLNPASVTFREQVSGVEVVLTPENCKSFTAGRDSFTSYQGTRIINTDDAGKIVGLLSDTVKKDTIRIFLRQIYRYADYALYKLYDGKRINYYFSDGGEIAELEYYESLKDNAEAGANTGTVVPHEGYKGYLYRTLKDKGDRNFQRRIKELAYKESDLVNFLAYVFGDTAHHSEARRNHYPSEIWVGAGVAGNMGSLEYSGGTVAFKQTSVAPFLEVGLRLYSQRNFGRFFLQPSVSGMPLSNTFDGGVYKLQSVLLTANLGLGYLFVKQPAFSVYAVANGALCVPVALQTQRRQNDVEIAVTSTDLNDRLTVRPEAGVVINKSWNILVSGFLPLRLPFEASSKFYRYKVSQLSLGIRYAFLSGGKKK